MNVKFEAIFKKRDIFVINSFVKSSNLIFV